MAWPKESGIYSMVQIDLDGQPYIAFRKGNEVFHRQILRRFLLDAAVLFGSRTVTDGPYVFELPNPRGLNYTLMGAGVCKVNLEEKDAAFDGRSGDFDKDIDEASIVRIQKRYPEWSMYKSQ